MGWYSSIFSKFGGGPATSNTNKPSGYNSFEEAILAAGKDEKKKRFLQYAEKAVSRVRQDIKSWNDALRTAQSEEPKNFQLELLYNEIMLDALLTSQIENRTQQVFSSEFSLYNAAGEVDEEQTTILRQLPAYRRLTGEGLKSRYHVASLVELELVKKETGEMDVVVISIPRTNIVPQKGLFYPDYTEDKSIPYRDMPEYGTYILEYFNGDLGLLNKAVVHVLFKRFAQSCWSELCEIYGIPPRVLTTNTQDATMLNRAQKMMADMGAASWFIIDESEKFEWAQGVATNGDVYNNLIKLCSNEISLLISGAIIGQDTQNGNRSKEESSQNMLWELVQSDMAMLEEQWNNINLPALVKLGIIKPGLRFEFNPTEDISQLWEITVGALPYYTIDPEWVKTKFGIEITGERQQAAATAASGKETAKQMFSGFFD